MHVCMQVCAPNGRAQSRCPKCSRGDRSVARKSAQSGPSGSGPLPDQPSCQFVCRSLLSSHARVMGVGSKLGSVPLQRCTLSRTGSGGAGGAHGRERGGMMGTIVRSEEAAVVWKATGACKHREDQRE